MTAPSVADVKRLGPANYQARVQAGAMIGGTLYAVTFRQEPVHLVAYDPEAARVTDTWAVPTEGSPDSPGAWNLLAYDDRFLYTVLANPSDVLRFDRKAETFERLGRVSTTDERVTDCKGIGVDDGRVVFATKNSPVIHTVEHAAGEIAAVGPPRPGAQKAHDLAIDDGVAYVVGGSDAYLAAVDLATGDHRDLLPPALTDESFAHSIDVAADGRLVLGTGDRLAVVDPAAWPGDATVVDLPLESGASSGAITAISVVDGVAYFTTTDPAYAIWACDLEDPAGSVRRLAAPIDHPTRTIFAYDGGLLGVGSGGHSAVWTLDPATGDASKTVLVDVGLPRGAGNVQSLVGTDDVVYAGGSRVTGIHHFDSGSFEQFTTAGEPKVMRFIDGRLYQAVYGGAGLLEYDPTDGRLRELAWIGHEQNRPRALHHHAASNRLLMGSRPNKGRLGGAVATYDLANRTLVGVDRNVVTEHSVTALASIEDTVYLGTEIYGGFGTEPVAERARIAAWDPITRDRRWSVAPFPDVSIVRGLTAHGGRLYGQTDGDRFFAFDPERREVIDTWDFGPDDGYDVPDDRAAHYREVLVGDCQVVSDRVFGVNFDRLFVYEPTTESFTILLSGLEGDEGWHNFPQLAADRAGRLYLADGTDLVRVTVD